MANLNHQKLPARRNKSSKKTGLPPHKRLLDRYADMLTTSELASRLQQRAVSFDKGYTAFHEFGTNHMTHRSLLLANPETSTLIREDAELMIEILRYLHTCLPNFIHKKVDFCVGFFFFNMRKAFSGSRPNTSGKSPNPDSIHY